MKKKIRNSKRAKWTARRNRTAKSVVRSDRPRLTVFRSAKHIYAQLVDPVTGSTVAMASTRTPSLRADLASGGNVEGAKRVGQAIAALAREKQIEEVVFNRNGFLYHGRVKALADAAREAGLRF